MSHQHTKSPRKLKRRGRPIYRRPPPSPAPEVLTTHPEAVATKVCLLAYGPEGSLHQENASVADIQRFRARSTVLWVDIAGLADTPLIQEIGRLFDLHPLALEDIVHTHQRAKVEDYGKYHFIVLRMAPIEGEKETDQLSLFVGDGYVLTFQERPGDDLNSVRERIRSRRGRITEMGADYLVYAILDAAVDAYFPFLERHGSELEDMEDTVITQPDPHLLSKIYTTRRSLLSLRRAIWPLREAIGSLVRDDSHRFTPETRVFLRDVYDHTVQILDLMETYRELSTNLMDVYLSSMNNRMSEVMKVLTIITTLFIPLSFIAGVYGMNFDTERSRWNMPELEHPYGYVICIGAMALIALGEFYYFYRKGWIGSRDRRQDEEELTSS